MDSTTKSHWIHFKLGSNIIYPWLHHCIKSHSDRRAGKRTILPDLDTDWFEAVWALGGSLMTANFESTCFFFGLTFGLLFIAFAPIWACLCPFFASLSAVIWAFFRSSAALRAALAAALSSRLFWASCCFCIFARALPWALICFYSLSCSFSCSLCSWSSRV